MSVFIFPEDALDTKVEPAPAPHQGTGQEEPLVPEDPARHAAAALAQLLERQIGQQTFGRLHRLSIELTGGRVVVHGCTASYYIKQLALHAVREVLPSMPLELDVQVLPSDSGLPKSP